VFDLKCNFHLINCTYHKLPDTFRDLLGVDEAVAAAEVGYFYGAVSVSSESG